MLSLRQAHSIEEAKLGGTKANHVSLTQNESKYGKTTAKQ